MNKGKLGLITSVVLISLLTGCGGSDDKGNDTNRPDVTPPDSLFDVASAVKCTNTGLNVEGGTCPADWSGEYNFSWKKGDFLFSDGSEAPKESEANLTRWSSDPAHGLDSITGVVDGKRLIPVYFQKNADPRFIYALDKVEEIIGYKLFDRKGVIELALSGVACEEPNYASLSGPGFIFSQGTAVEQGEGNVSFAPHCSNITYNQVDASFMIISSGRLPVSLDAEKGFTWINLDSANGTASNDVAVHELAHALGMIRHFDGFGHGAAFNVNAVAVLKTMYSEQNPPGQPFNSLYVEK